MPSEAAIALVTVENGLAIVIEPIMGGWSDQTLRQVGSRFPLITVGAIAASALFIVIPLLGVAENLGQVGRWLAMGVLVAWSIAMALFHSPVLSLLRRYSSVPQLPFANSGFGVGLRVNRHGSTSSQSINSQPGSPRDVHHRISRVAGSFGVTAIARSTGNGYFSLGWFASASP